MEAVNRRRFLTTTGATLSLGALVAACGGESDAGGIPRVGTVPPTTALPDAPVTDVALLRTSTSLEHSAMNVYEALGSTLGADAGELASRFLADHEANAATFAELTTAAGGEVFACPNPRFQRVYIEPAIQLIEGGDEVEPSPDAAADSLTVAHALESLIGSTCQSFVPMLNDQELRMEMMNIGQQAARRSAVLAMLINPDVLIDSSSLPGGTAAEEGASTTFAVPGAFGSLAPIPITIGAPDENGTATTVNPETLSLNSLAYEYLGACEA